MRNLKKILALVLAMVMTFSVMATANAFTDDKDVDATYEEAIEVLSGLKVFEGFEDGSFQPKGNITRAQVAAIIYRVVTGDVTNAQVGIYADYNKFTDVKSTAWYAGYVNFCANAEYIKGYGDGTFGPDDQVTGYQALAMILRAIGYDKNGEFTGSNWQVQTAAVGKKLGVTDNITAGTLGTAATREVVAEILFQTIANATQVDYTVAFGYTTYGNNTLGAESFGLKSEATQDKWGRPGVQWTATKPAAVKGTVATVYETPNKTYTTAVTECQVASDLGLKANTTYPTYINGVVNTATVTIERTDIVNSIGAQGRLTEVYDDCIVMIDTYLAAVEDVTAVATDAAGHIYRQATMTLKVYDAVSSAYTTVVVAANSNYSYAKGDYVLVNAYTQAYNSAKISTKSTTINGASKTTFTYGVVLGAAQSMTGAQTNVWANAAKHTVNGTDYADANTYYLDAAQKTAFVNYTWFFDSYGNLIGSDSIAATYTYAILKDVIWNIGTPGWATATLIDAATGAETTATINKIDGDDDTTFDWDTLAATPWLSGTNNTYNFSGSCAYMSNESILNTNYLGYALYRVETLSTGAVNLVGKVDTTTVVNHATGVTISNDGTYFTANSTLATVNNNTVFTIRTGTLASGYTYTQYVGKTNVPTYKNCEVFYADKNADGFVDYVYIKSGTADNSTNNFILATSATYYNNLYNNVNVYGLYGALVNGTANTSPILTDDVTDFTSNLLVKANGHFKPFYVTYGADGKIDTVTAFTNSTQTAADGVTKYIELNTQGKSKLDGTTFVNDGYLNNAGEHYNVATTEVYGDYAKITDVTSWADVDVYVVYKMVGGFRVVTQMYIFNEGIGGSTPVAPITPVTPDTLTLAKDGNVVKATYTNNGSTTLSVKVVYQYRVSGSGSGYTTFTDGNSYTIAAGASETWMSSSAALTLPSGGYQTYEVIVTAYSGTTVLDSVTDNYFN